MKILKLLKILCWVDDKTIIGSSNNKVYLVDILSEKVLKSLIIPPKFTEVFRFSRLASRLFRLGIQASCILDDHLYIAYNCYIYLIQLSTFSIIKRYNGFKGKSPLYLVPVENIPGFEKGVYFGEYFNNKLKTECSVFYINPAEIRKVFTFKTNSIEHIHNLVPDLKNECLWIFTGDFGQSPGIYIVKDNFKDVKPTLVGNQKYRACFGFPYRDGLVYFTDSQFSLNYMIYLYQFNGEWLTESLSQIQGPCIFGTILKDYIVYTTCTEPEISKNKIKNYFTNTPSKFIESNHVTLNIMNKDLKIVKSFSFAKDIYPMVLFQFGNIILPSSNVFNNILFAYLVAIKLQDQTNLKINLDELGQKTIL